MGTIDQIKEYRAANISRKKVRRAETQNDSHFCQIG